MEWVRPDININFMKAMRWTSILSVLAVTASLVLLFLPGPNYGIDFKGGTEIQFSLDKPLEIGALRAVVEKSGFSSTDLVVIGKGDKTYRIRLQAEVAFTEKQIKEVTAALKERFKDPGIESVKFSPGGEKITIKAKGALNTAEVEVALRELRLELRDKEASLPPAGATTVPAGDLEKCPDPVCPFGPPTDYTYEAFLAGIGGTFLKRVGNHLAGKNRIFVEEIEWVGPKVGKQFRDAGIKSVLYALLLVLIYVALRFDLRFAPGAVICLFHDVVITLGIFVILRQEMVLATVAAMLTIVGYSLNDTIVIFDRIRENMARVRERELRIVVNRAINETMGRTIITALTTILSILPILFLTRGTIQGFALALIIGIVVGTYSTIYIASPIAIWIDTTFYQRKARR